MMSLKNEIKQQVNSGKLIHLIITKEEIDSNNFQRINILLKALEECKQKSKNKLFITFLGYDNNLKEFYEIKKIRSYVYKIFKKDPHIFYFLSSAAWTTVLLCLFNVKRLHHNSLTIGVRVKSSRSIIDQIIDGTISYGLKIGETEDNLQKYIYNMFDNHVNPQC